MVGYIPITPEDSPMHTCFPLAPMEVPKGQQAETIKNTPLFTYNSYDDLTVPWFLSDLSFWMFRPVYAGTPNWYAVQDWAKHKTPDTYREQIRAFLENIMNGRDPMLPKNGRTKSLYNFFKKIGIYLQLLNQ